MKYQSKPETVEAFEWLENCPRKYWPSWLIHADNEGLFRSQPATPSIRGEYVLHGNYIVRKENGNIYKYTNEEFHAAFYPLN